MDADKTFFLMSCDTRKTDFNRTKFDFQFTGENFPRIF